MAKKVEIRFKPQDFNSFRNSKEMQALLGKLGEQVKSRADAIGSGKYEVVVNPGETRASVTIRAKDAKSRASNAKHNTLLKALRGGG